MRKLKYRCWIVNDTQVYRKTLNSFLEGIRDIRSCDSQMVDFLSVKSIRNFNCTDKYTLQNISEDLSSVSNTFLLTYFSVKQVNLK